MRIAYPCEFAYGNRRVVTLMQLSSDFYMLEAKADHHIGDRAYNSDGLEDGLKQDGVNMAGPHRPTRKLKTRNRRHLCDINAAGLSSASLHGCNGNAAYSFAGNIAPQASFALCSSPRPPCFSVNFEIDSRLLIVTVPLFSPIGTSCLLTANQQAVALMPGRRFSCK